jgi:hypothetical protein
MIVRVRHRLAGTALALTLAAGLTAAGPASADTLPVPVDTTCLSGTNVTDILQCTVSTVTGTVGTVTSTTGTLLPGGTTATGTSTGVSGTGSTPYVVSTSTQPRTAHATTTKTRHHYRKHRSGHRHKNLVR